MTSAQDVSVVICTYNRCEMLGQALGHIVAQQVNSPSFEIIVVDNNSTDRTRNIIESFAEKDRRVRYVFEKKQGICHARNAGIAAARADVIAFTDDDVRVPTNWVATIKRAYDQHPHVEFVGGKVLPRWSVKPPPWLTQTHWSPLALVDYGPQPFITDAGKQVCLVGATLSFRRRVFERVGTFSPAYQHASGGVCSTDDHEMLLRVWSSGGCGLYVPDLIIHADVQPERLEKKYHRRWHRDHGQLYAKMRILSFERASWRLFGVPAHIYRQAIADLAGWLWHSVTADDERAFLHETRLCFFVGYARARYKDFSRQ